MRMRSWLQYVTMAKFMAPLLITSLAIDIAELALNRGLANSNQAVHNLASFSIGYKILQLFTAAVEDFKYVSLVLLRCRTDRLRVMLCSVVFGSIAFIVMMIIGLTPAGDLLITKLHDVSPRVGRDSKKVVLYFAAFVLFDGIAWAHTGILIQYKRSSLAGAGSIVDMLTQVIVIVISVQYGFSSVGVPVLACYLGLLARLVLVMCAYYKCVAPILPVIPLDEDSREPGEERRGAVPFPVIVKIWIPLAAVRVSQRVTRPLMNLFVARDHGLSTGRTKEDAVRALAAMSVTFPLAHAVYGSLNELRALEPTFAKKSGPGGDSIPARKTRFFGMFCGCVSLGVMLILWWTPGAAAAILHLTVSVKEDVIAESLIPLKIMTCLGVLTMTRSVLTGWLLRIKKTPWLYSSVVSRLVVHVAMLALLPKLNVHGATLGTASFCLGYFADVASVAIAAIILHFRRRNRCSEVPLIVVSSDLRTKSDEQAAVPLGSAVSTSPTDEMISSSKNVSLLQCESRV